MKFISKILDYLPPVAFFLFFSFIVLFLIADSNHIDMPILTIALYFMIIYWPITLGSLFFLAGIGVANLFYKASIKKELKDD